MKKLIYIVDDNDSMRLLIQRVLEEKFSTKTFHQVQNLLLECAVKKPDLIISDIMMPDMDGYELCAHLKSHDEFSSIPVVLISAKSGTHSRSTGFRLGAVGYLEKPFDANELIVLIQSILSLLENSNHKPFESEQIEVEGLSVDTLSFEAKYQDNPLNLTKTEGVILRVLMASFDHICTRELIQSELHLFSGSESRVLDTHMKNLRKKLIDLPFEVKTIYGEGYKLLKLKNS